MDFLHLLFLDAAKVFCIYIFWRLQLKKVTWALHIAIFDWIGGSPIQITIAEDSCAEK
jgi:hypothetical protein